MQLGKAFGITMNPYCQQIYNRILLGTHGNAIAAENMKIFGRLFTSYELKNDFWNRGSSDEFFADEEETVNKFSVKYERNPKWVSVPSYELINGFL